MSTCKVAYCRYPATHVTKGHKCGTCGEYGHGQAECGNIYSIQHLQLYYSDELPNHKRCTVQDCTKPMYHTIDAHNCESCGKRAKHTKVECARKDTEECRYEVECPVCRTENIVTSTRKVFGITDVCCICSDNNVNVLLPNCYHCVICWDCLVRL